MREVEIKALLTEAHYNSLQQTLQEKYEQVEDDTITTYRFRPHDVRVRFSEKINERVYKSDDPTVHNREEITMKLASREDATRAIQLLEELGFKADPSWIKRKQEFLAPFEGETYTLSLQFIENFAYLLEVEMMTEDNAAENQSVHRGTLLIGASANLFSYTCFSAGCPVRNGL